MGYAAQQPDAPTAGRFYVDLKFFQPLPPTPDDAKYEVPGNYWIVALGPKVFYTVLGREVYDWVVVTNNSDQEQLYILTRDFEKFESEYDAEVLKLVANMGF